jgi:hypothetical protein
MKSLARALLMMGTAVALPACPGDGNSNPPQLWLALDGDELHAKLADAQPPHF